MGCVCCRSAEQKKELEQKLAGALKAAEAASAAKQASAGALKQCAPSPWKIRICYLQQDYQQGPVSWSACACGADEGGMRCTAGRWQSLPPPRRPWLQRARDWMRLLARWVPEQGAEGPVLPEFTRGRGSGALPDTCQAPCRGEALCLYVFLGHARLKHIAAHLLTQLCRCLEASSTATDQ